MKVTPLYIPHKHSYWDGCKFNVWCFASLFQTCSLKLALTWHPCKDQKRVNIKVNGLACPLHLPGDPVFVLGVVGCLLMVMGCRVCCSWCSLPRKEMQPSLIFVLCPPDEYGSLTNRSHYSQHFSKGAGTFHSAGQSKEDNLVLTLPSIRFSLNFYQIISGTKYE